jgi:hypothetical protein
LFSFFPSSFSPQIQSYNLALSNQSRDVTSFGGSCDYENYYIEGGDSTPSCRFIPLFGAFTAFSRYHLPLLIAISPL